MSLHIYHATATLTELSLAMSIASMAKIFPQPKTHDSLMIETWSKRIDADVSKRISLAFYWLCVAENSWRRWLTKIPHLVFVTQLSVLMAMGYCPEKNSHALFWLALGLTLIMFLWVISNRAGRDAEESSPLVEPID